MLAISIPTHYCNNVTECVTENRCESCVGGQGNELLMVPSGHACGPPEKGRSKRFGREAPLNKSLIGVGYLAGMWYYGTVEIALLKQDMTPRESLNTPKYVVPAQAATTL